MNSEENKPKRKKLTPRQILAWIGILLLVSMYTLNLVLALIGSDLARDLLKGTVVMTIAVPILLYGMLVVMQGASRFNRKPEDELTEEEKIGYYRMVEERDEQRYEERRQAQEARRAARAKKKAK